MEQSADPNFLYIADEGGVEKSVLVNLNLVRTVEGIRDGQITLRFDINHTITLHGKAANELAHTLWQRTVLTNGEPFKPYLEKAFKNAQE